MMSYFLLLQRNYFSYVSKLLQNVQNIFMSVGLEGQEPGENGWAFNRITAGTSQSGCFASFTV